MKTRSAVPVILLALAASLGGCRTARPPLEQAIRARDYERVAAMLDADSALRNDSNALYYASLARATAGTAVYDPARARAGFELLLTRFPLSEHRLDALRLDSLLVRAERLAADTLRLARAVAASAQQIDSLESRVADQHRTVLQLQADVKKTEAQLKAVQDELERLKAVDLRLSRPRAGRRQ